MDDYSKAIEICLKFLNQYKFLSEMYIIEFFTNNHWEKLPSSWQNLLMNYDPLDLGTAFFESNNKLHEKKVWPLSLISFKKCTEVLSLSRKQENISLSDNEIAEENLHIFRKHVKPKKQHEIRILSKLVHSIFTKENCSSVIDVGSGQGHLSRMLSFGYKIQVTSLECENLHLIKAKKFDDEAKLLMEKAEVQKPLQAKKSLNEISLDFFPPNHLQLQVSPNISPAEFKKILDADLLKCDSSDKKNLYHQALLTGLHACGDLSATMIKLFNESPDIHALVSVGCCYMKLTTCEDLFASRQSSTCNTTQFYPMSTFVKSIKNHDLSYKARELACHAIEDFQNRLIENGLHLRIHCYRAVLEYIIRQSFPNLIRPGVQTIKKAYLLSFEEYAKKAFKKLGLGEVPTSEIYSNKIKDKLKEWKKVVVLFTLAVMIAPVIESVILLDRLIYLLESNIESKLISIFDPLVSPRCFAIVAKKNTSNYVQCFNSV